MSGASRIGSTGYLVAILCYVSLLCPLTLMGQEQDSLKRLTFTGDFRFRIEEDWNSRKSDGSYRSNRTRLRYRMRFGAFYQYNANWQMGVRVRTGKRIKQQDPQLTLGDESEFGTLAMGFEKVFVQGTFKDFTFWLGKNTFPFAKQNELFWSDNVFPEGVFISHTLHGQSPLLESVKFGAGHFIIGSNNESFQKDNYFQGFQIHTTHLDQRLELFPSIFFFKNTPNIPDGQSTFTMDFAILHMGSAIQLLSKPALRLELDFYQNLKDYQSLDSISLDFKNQKFGFTGAIGLGQLKSKNDWIVKLTYTYLERYSIVDVMAQNDWARWDYSTYNSPDGRLSNFKGYEIMVGYALNKKLTLNMRSFFVDQLIDYGPSKETNSRIRFDIDIGF